MRMSSYSLTLRSGESQFICTPSAVGCRGLMTADLHFRFEQKETERCGLVPKSKRWSWLGGLGLLCGSSEVLTCCPLCAARVGGVRCTFAWLSERL